MALQSLQGNQAHHLLCSEANMPNKQMATTLSGSSVVEGSSLHSALMNSLSYSDSVETRSHEHHVIDGLAVPFVLGEAMDSFAFQRMATGLVIANSGEFRSSTQQEIHSSIWSRVPLPGASIIDTVMDGRLKSNEDQGKIASSDSLVYHSECTKTGVTDTSSDAMNSWLEPLNCGYEIVSLDTSTARDLNKCMIPSEVVGEQGIRPVQLTGSCCLPIEWMITEHKALSCDSPGSSRFRNDFSSSIAHRNSSRDQCSEISSSSGSMFLQAMQEILGEIALYALENSRIDENRTNFPFASGRVAGNIKATSCGNRDVEAEKKHLLILLQSVDDKYNQCLQEIHTVSSAFHMVTELDPNLHARFVLPTISYMYKNLRERISSHIILPLGLGINGGPSSTCIVEKQQRWALQQLIRKREKERDDQQHQLWRPQRGLPERSVCVLKAWMFQNFLHPYPKDADKHLLALKSGLTRNQVTNWFINARVRLWKPMIEEMYAELNLKNTLAKNY